ncbi:DUF1415 family protein [Thiolapillus sp.]
MTDAIVQTRCWVQEVVIGLNLCPFARVPFEAGSIRYQLCEAAGDDAVYAALIQELEDFAQLPPEEVETGLFIASRGLVDFDSYLDVLEDAQAALEEAGLDAMRRLLDKCRKPHSPSITGLG